MYVKLAWLLCFHFDLIVGVCWRMVWSGKWHKSSLFQVDLSGESGSSTTQAHELQQEVFNLQQSAEKQKCKQMEEIIQNVDEEMQDLRAEKENLFQVCI